MDLMAMHTDHTGLTRHQNHPTSVINFFSVSRDYQFVDIPKGKLGNGQEIPLLGIGTWQAEVTSHMPSSNTICHHNAATMQCMLPTHGICCITEGRLTLQPGVVGKAVENALKLGYRYVFHNTPHALQATV